jgi:GT2 family glycosyltransferase
MAMLAEAALGCTADALCSVATPELSVIIPTYNGMHYLPKCLRNVLTESRHIAGPVEVLVLDNGSTDGTCDFVQQQFPEVKVLSLEHNCGFAAACDSGIRAAHGRYCLLLNNDAWFSPGSLAVLLEFARTGDYAFTGPMMLNPDGTLQGGPLAIDFLGDPSQGSSTDQPFCVTGAALLARKVDYLELGGFDRRFFAFHEDLDLQWRAQLRGKRVGYTPDAQVYHVGGGTVAGAVPRPGKVLRTTRQRLFLGRRNQLASILMNHSAAALSWVLPLWLLSGLAECIGARASGYRGQASIYLTALIWNLRHLPQTWRYHETVQTRRRVSDKVIFSKFGPPFSRLRLAYQLARTGTSILTKH